MMSFKYWNKRDRNLGFKQISYGLFTFADFLLICDFRSIEYQSNDFQLIEYQSNETYCSSFFFIPNLSFFVLDFNVDHSKPMRLSFCHGLPTLQTQNLTIYIIHIDLLHILCKTHQSSSPNKLFNFFIGLLLWKHRASYISQSFSLWLFIFPNKEDTFGIWQK